MGPDCHVCGKPGTARSRGICVKCASIKRCSDPARREEMRRAKLKSLSAASPERREELRQIAVHNLRTWHEENPQAAAEVSRRIALRSVAWCPPEFREERARLRKLVGAAEARRIIEERIPGTAAHAKLTVLNNATAMRLKHEREVASRY